jgi:acylphosphatase
LANIRPSGHQTEFKAAAPGRERRLPMKCRLFRIKGRVQGVWFRESTRRQATALGITGYAKNMTDATVQVLACGEPEAMDQLAEWLKQGPPMAQVTNVEWSVMESECLESFVTR